MTQVVASYSESNYAGADIVLNNANQQAVGQTFTGDGGSLDSCKFYIQRLSGTGTAYAKIYAITGIYGSTSKPTGTALATSVGVDVSTIPGSHTLTTFSFTGLNRIVLTSGTNYAVTVEYASANANGIEVAIDQSSPTADGNGSYQDYGSSTWNNQATSDYPFYVYRDDVILDVTDHSTNTNDLTNIGGVVANTDTPFVASTYSADFNGSSNYLRITDAAQTGLDFQDFTLEFWGYLRSWPGASLEYNRCVIAKFDETLSYGYIVAATNSKQYPYVHIQNASGVTAYYGGAWTDTMLNTWHHWAVTVDISAATVKIYEDGSEITANMVANAATSIVDTTANFAVGAWDKSTPNRFWDGLLDEVRIFNTIRTSTEIASDYNQELLGNETGLIAYYPFESDIATTTSSSSSSSTSSTSSSSSTSSTSSSTSSTSSSSTSTTSSSTSSTSSSTSSTSSSSSTSSTSSSSSSSTSSTSSSSSSSSSTSSTSSSSISTSSTSSSSSTSSTSSSSSSSTSTTVPPFTRFPRIDLSSNIKPEIGFRF